VIGFYQCGLIFDTPHRFPARGRTHESIGYASEKLLLYPRYGHRVLGVYMVSRRR